MLNDKQRQSEIVVLKEKLAKQRTTKSDAFIKCWDTVGEEGLKATFELADILVNKLKKYNPNVLTIRKLLLEGYAGSFDSKEAFALEVNAVQIVKTKESVPESMQRYFQFDVDEWIKDCEENRLFLTHCKDGRCYIFWG